MERSGQRLVVRSVADPGEKVVLVSRSRRKMPLSSEGCVRLDRTKIRMIQNNPSGYYVNVHNNLFPNGAVRGQLSPAGM
jgi:hypothetical protein